MMNALPQHAIDYVIWQNRATRFYVAARHCYLGDMMAPAAFCAVTALELILKATLVYHDHGFDPQAAGHALAKLQRMLRHNVPAASGFSIPSYFHFERRYLLRTRYPAAGRGVMVPATFLSDLDTAIVGLTCLTSFQHNTELRQILAERQSVRRTALTRGNTETRRLLTFLGVSPRRRKPSGA